MARGQKADDPCPSINIRLSPITGLDVQCGMPPEQAYFVLHMVVQRIMIAATMPPPPNGMGIQLPPGVGG